MKSWMRVVRKGFLPSEAGLPQPVIRPFSVLNGPLCLPPSPGWTNLTDVPLRVPPGQPAIPLRRKGRPQDALRTAD